MTTATASVAAASDLRSTCCEGVFYRPFTREQSSAIANLHIEAHGVQQNGFVEVIYQSNPERAYGFHATPGFTAHLIWVICSPDLLGLSLGRIMAQARKDGSLSPVETDDEGL